MEEKVLMKGVANPLSKSGLALKNGHGVLTNKRFIFCKHSLGKVLAVGIFVNLMDGDFEYDIPLSEILSAETGRHMLGQALTITKRNGEVLKYGIMKPLDWKIAFENALSAPLSECTTEMTEPPETQSQDSTKRFCQNCGVKIMKDGKFCSSCGAKL